VLADRGGIGEALARRLRERGASCEIVPPLLPRASAREIEALLGAAASRTRGIVHLWGLEARALGQELACGSVPPLLRAMLKAAGPPPPLWIVTRGAQGVAGGAPEPAQATLWGLGRVAAMEDPELRIVRVDLDPAVPEAHAAESLLTELGPELAAARGTSASDPGAGAEDQVAWRGGARWVPRLVRVAGPSSSHGFQARPDASYLITGGLGALGLAVASWLAERGARHLVLLGRHAPTAAAGATLEALERRGVCVLAARADVAREDELAAVLERCGRELPPLAGVVHAAGILDDGILLQQDWPRFAAVLAPKVQGAANLDRLTRHLPLDLFVLFSSAAALLGSPGQGSYAAANAHLDAMAERRRAEGLAGLSIAWGAWIGAGMAATGGTAARDRRSARGISSIDFDSGLATLDLLLAGPSEAAHVAVLPILWPDFVARAGRPVPFLAELAGPRQARPPLSGPATTDSGAGRRLRETLRRAPQNQRRELLREHVRAEVAAILRLTPATPIYPQQPLTELGLDSLVGLELTRALGASVGRQLPATLLYEQPTLEALTLHLEELLAREEPPATAADTAPGTAGAPATTADIAGTPATNTSTAGTSATNTSAAGTSATPVATAGTPATTGRTAGTPATAAGNAGKPATVMGTTGPAAVSGEIPDPPLSDVEALLELELMDVDRLLNETAR
jgi:polyketide synthase 12/myxalamid-type polyketide synthase MxaF